MAKNSGGTKSSGSVASRFDLSGIPDSEKEATAGYLDRISKQNNIVTLQDIAQTAKDIFADSKVSFESAQAVVNAAENKIEELRNKSASYKIDKNRILNYLRVSNSRYRDISKVEIFETPQGNYRLYYGNQDTGLTVGKNRLISTKDELRRLGLLKE